MEHNSRTFPTRKLLLPALIGLLLTGCNDNNDDLQARAYAMSVAPVIQEAYLSEKVAQIGGATTAVARYDDGSNVWTLFNMADRLAATPVQSTAGSVSEIRLPDYIQDILVVNTAEADYALLALGGSGIAVVDITNPAAMQLLHTVNVNYYQDGVIYAEGGGALVTDVVLEGNGSIKTLETDGTTLWIGNESYGIHRTALANLLNATTETDGSLLIEHETYTLQYAGEHAWGSPADLKLHDGLLYAAIGFLGVGIYDPVTLDRVGYYNLYTDTAVHEDWFIDMDVTSEVQADGVNGVASYIDPDTGMPNYYQANFEIEQVWHGNVDAATPWADFDRYGKYYYKANALDVTGSGANVKIYVAYGLGGVVAVAANAGNPAAVSTSYLGYAPAVPAHGPDEPTGEQSKSLFPYFGVGMLKESGIIDIQADPANNRVYYADHFAGLVILEGADDPATHWKQGGGNFDNDTISPYVLGDHWPDYEFVTSYDMSPNDPTDNESLPAWMYANDGPALLVTGEISGHGNALFLQPLLAEGDNAVDVVQATGSGGLNFIELVNLAAAAMADRFATPAYFASTDEIGAAADGSASEQVAIGHTQGVTTDGKYLYVADGPHGMSVWQIADDFGKPVVPHLVANTLMDEYAVDNGLVTVYPTPHAYNVVLSAASDVAYVLSQSLGLRRVDISGVANGAVGAPLLLQPQPSDFFEHNTLSGSYLGIHRQDHAYDVELYGNYAVVADGSNGLTVYDLTQNPDPAVTTGEHVVDNLGSATNKPLLGRPTGVALWTDNKTGHVYGFVAAGHAGVAAVDMTEILVNGTAGQMELIKIFEPIKIEDDSIGKADSRAVDVHVIGDHVYFSYSGFGMVAYRIADMLAPLPDGVAPDKIWKKGDFDYRPAAVGQFNLSLVAGYEDSDGEALYMMPQYFPANTLLKDGLGGYFILPQPKLLFYVAYGPAGVVKLDWSDAANPVLLQHQDTVGAATGVTIAHGRVFVADYAGGLVFFQ